MALQQVLLTDSVGQDASVTFNNPTQVDQVSFSSNSITLAACSSFNLTKSDLILYGLYLSQFNTSLLVNFPSIALSINTAFPLSAFQVNITSAGVTHINYLQTSGSNTVYSINYVPIATSASFVARASPVTITLQEFYMCVYVFSQYISQVSLN